MTAPRVIHDEAFVAEHPVLKRLTLFVLPVIPEDAPYRIREGIARRRIAATTGQCPCGAMTDYGDPRPGQIGVGEVLHARRCPADTARLVKAIRRWSA